MKYIEAPSSIEINKNVRSLFLAGGITGCPDWQSAVSSYFEKTDLTILNPRRKDFDVRDPTASEKQIKWESDALLKADKILFWFCAETIQPIVLYELGAWSMTMKPIFVGVHPDYPRKNDVLIQTKIKRPELEIVNSLDSLCKQVYDSIY